MNLIRKTAADQGLTLYNQEGERFKTPSLPLSRNCALTHLVLNLHYCALRTFHHENYPLASVYLNMHFLYKKMQFLNI